MAKKKSAEPRRRRAKRASRKSRPPAGPAATRRPSHLDELLANEAATKAAALAPENVFSILKKNRLTTAEICAKLGCGISESEVIQSIRQMQDRNILVSL